MCAGRVDVERKRKELVQRRELLEKHRRLLDELGADVQYQCSGLLMVMLRAMPAAQLPGGLGSFGPPCFIVVGWDVCGCGPYPQPFLLIFSFQATIFEPNGYGCVLS